MKRGLFITLEGPEGSGKTTQAKRLIHRLQEQAYEVLYTRVPGGTPTGELIREILQHDKAGEPLCPESEVLLFAASRAQLVRNVIEPALAEGRFVISDRFLDSTTAYQGYGRGFPVDLMERINAFAVGATMPDVTFLLDIDPDTGMERLLQRHLGFEQLDRIEQEERAFHERVRAGYRELVERHPRIRLVDGNRPADVIEEHLWTDIREIMRERS